MNRERVLSLVGQINVWKRGDQRAPHKPLLLLLALGKCARREERLIPYEEVDESLRPLLVEFGPSRQSYHPEYPFWRLKNDGLWELTDTDDLELRQSSTDAKKSELLRHHVRGGLAEPVFRALQDDSDLLFDVVDLLLERNFPESLHADICNAVGLERNRFVVSKRLQRDPGFRFRVLTAYSYRCAICGFDMRLGQQSVGLEAAHIKWHQAGGPDTVNNGLCLCVLHHKLFDLGAFTLSNERQVLVSDLVYGYGGADEWTLRYHGHSLLAPQNPSESPYRTFTEWHRREVFKGTPRYLEEAVV
jgi:putative restriction endonuclease